MSTDRRISVYDNKYTFVLPANDYRVHVLRYGEPWVVIESGCNAVRPLTSELIDATVLIDAVKAWAAASHSGREGDLVSALWKYQEERGEKQVAPPFEAVPPHVGLTPADVAEARRLHELVASPGHETSFEIRRDIQRLLERVIAAVPTAPRPAPENYASVECALASSAHFLESMLAEGVPGQRIRLQAAIEGVQRALAYVGHGPFAPGQPVPDAALAEIVRANSRCLPEHRTEALEMALEILQRRAATAWSKGVAPANVRCLVAAPHPQSGVLRVFVASLSPDHRDGGGYHWFAEGQRLHGVIAWMPAPEPANERASAPDGDEAP